MKTTLKKILCIVIALSCAPMFGCSNKDSPTDDAEASISDAVSVSDDNTTENSASDDADVGTTTTTKKTTTTGVTTATTTTVPDVTVTDESGEVLTNTLGKPIYVTTITDTQGEVVAVTTATDADGEAVTDSKGKAVTATVALTAVTTVPVITTTTTKPQTAATTVATTKAQTVATTKTTTTAKPVTTTAKPTAANGVCSTVVMAEGEPITVYYYDEKPENATLQAYSDLAEYGILTDEIRQLITDDVMNYAITKYGCWHDTTRYANSTTDYNCSFLGGAKNSDHNYTFETVALMIKWGALESSYIVPSLNTEAKNFQAEMYRWVDYTVESEETEGFGANVGFCYFKTTGSYNTYQVSFIY